MQAGFGTILAFILTPIAITIISKFAAAIFFKKSEDADTYSGYIAFSLFILVFILWLSA
jgi:hypothetical protein